MSNYGLPLSSPSKQTILPILTEDGRVRGWYPIAVTTFNGTETSYTTSDGVVVPLKTVTTDTGNGISQYMAAVFPVGLPFNYFPWASADLVDGGEGYYRWWSLPTEAWTLHFGAGPLIEGLEWGLGHAGVSPPTPPAPPGAANGTLTWRASVKYEALFGNCPFFDFNWITLFQAQSTTVTPLRIVVTSNPAPIAPATVPPMKASVIALPVATPNGPVYDTVRIMKLADQVPPGTYTWTFAVYDDQGQSTPVNFVLTVL